MILLRSRLSIDDLITQIMQIPAQDLCLEHLQDWIARLDLREDLLQSHVSFCNQSYQRKLLCRTSRFDLLVLGWQPGQCSSVHDHLDSLNVTRVYQGELTARVFEPEAPSAITPSATALSTTIPAIRLVQEEQLQSGELALVDRHQIHQLANLSNQPLVTLHVYARPLEEIRVYSPTGAEKIPIRYSFDDAQEQAA